MGKFIAGIVIGYIACVGIELVHALILPEDAIESYEKLIDMLEEVQASR